MWLRNLLLSIDQFMNALIGGNPDLSISARVGYHQTHSESLWWDILGGVIDSTFYPIDGPDHCIKAFNADSEDYRSQSINPVAMVSLGVVITVSCILLALPIVLISFFITKQPNQQ